MLLATQNTAGKRVRFWRGADWEMAMCKLWGRWEEVGWGTRRNYGNQKANIEQSASNFQRLKTGLAGGNAEKLKH